MNFNHFPNHTKKEDSFDFNDDLFEKNDLDSDNDQIILNEINDEECSFLSSEPEKNSNNINNENKNNDIKGIIDNINIESDKLNDNLLNNIISEKNNIKDNQVNKIKNNEIQSTKSPKENKKYFTKNILYNKNKKQELSLSKKIDNHEKKNIEKNNQNEKKEKITKNYIHKTKEIKNIKINHNHMLHKKNINNEVLNNFNDKEKKNKSAKTEVNYAKYGIKDQIIKKEPKNLVNHNKKNNENITYKKFIKIDKKLNISYDNVFKKNKKINSSKNTNDASFTNSKSSKFSYKKKNLINSTTPKYKSRNESKTSFYDKNGRENKNFDNSENLKKILINKINKQINEIIKDKEKRYFNENNNLFFLGFCDLLFEIGFLHIKETEIKDISDIKKHIKDLYTQPFTNKALLCENFLFHEQHLLICAWKTILNNFSLIDKFHSLPEENEEISLDDCKLFIFIVIGLFIGYHNISNDMNNKKEISKNKVIMTNDENIKNKRNFKYHFRKKSEKSLSRDSNNEDQFSKTWHENILMNILKNREKSDYNYKNIFKIKNFFGYFAELRKLYNFYQKELKSINKKLSLDKELTFNPKTNKNDNKILLSKFSKKMDFFERNDVIKKRNEKKIIILQRERSKKLLKECTFEPCHKKNKSNKKALKLSPKEISNRLYENDYSSKRKNSKNSQNTNNTELIKSNSKRIYLKTPLTSINFKVSCKKPQEIYSEKKSKELYNFKPNINKKINRGMFSQSPLDNDELVNKRIKDLRDANLFRFIKNYEKNSRAYISDDIKKDKNLIKQLMFEEKKNMKLDIEKKTNKDTFDNFISINDFPSFENAFYNNNEIKASEPIFTVEIKIKDNIKTIEVFKDDFPEKISYDFCVENSLGKKSYEKILNIIKAKLEEINKESHKQELDIKNNIENNNNNDDINLNELDNKKINNNEYNENEIIKENNNNSINMDINLNEENIKEAKTKENDSINFNDSIDKEPDINNNSKDDFDFDLNNYENDADIMNGIAKKNINNGEKKPDVNNNDIEDENIMMNEEN